MPKIVLPHFQTAAAENSNLQYVNFLAAEFRKVSFVTLEIVIVFPDSPSFLMLGKIFQQPKCNPTTNLVSLLLATPGLAQEASPEQFVGGLQVEVSDSLTQIKSALIMRDQQIAALQQQAAAKDKTIADLTKERDDLKAKASK